MYTKNTISTSHISPAHLYTLFGLTIVMWITADYFRIPGILTHPQFTEAISPEYLTELMAKEPRIDISYHLFFVIDFIWAPLLLWALCKYMLGKLWEKNRNPNRDLFRTLFRIFLTMALVAYGLDIAENSYYVCYRKYNEDLVLAKNIAYGIVLLSVILTYLHYTFRKYIKTIVTFITASTYSLIILVVLGSFLPRAPQVNSIVVNLYERPVELAILFLVAPTFAVVLAHYPSYFNIDEKKRSWFMGDWRLGLIGIVFYKYKKAYNSDDNGKREDEVNFLYRILGILFYVALFYILGYTSEVNFGWQFQVSKMAIIMLVAGIVLLYVLKRRKDAWFDKVAPYLEKRFPGFYDGDNPSDPKNLSADATNECKATNEKIAPDILADLFSIRQSVITFSVIFGLAVIVHFSLILYLWFCEDCRYTELTAHWSMACILLQMVSYVYFRTFRSTLRFVFYKNTKAINNAFYILREIETAKTETGVINKEVSLSVSCKKEHIKTFFEDVDFKPAKPDKGFKRYLVAIQIGYYNFLKYFSFGALSNNVTFLQSMAVVGFLNILFYIGINIFSEQATGINPILIILSALFFFYGTLVVLTKNFIYYKFSEERVAWDKRSRYNFFLVLGLLMLVVLNRLKAEMPNNLFTLPLVERNIDNEESLENYVKGLSKDQVRYYIACYGGGMKSNAWTMTVLKALYDQDPDFFKKTVGISGASGGTVGLANMTAIINANSDNDQVWDSIIKKISTENMLSLDLTHTLGRDLFNYLLVPRCTLAGKDRSSKAMSLYAKMTNNADEVRKPTAYRAFWKNLYDNQGKQFPILISNSTNTRGNGGMAVSVRTSDALAEKILYHDSDNVLEVQKTEYNSEGRKENTKALTLSFFDAVSTSNRFPLISPAAKIETKGHFNDGGIYENSGLLSIWKLYQAVDYLEKRDSTKNNGQKNVFINIVNDKDQYIKKRIACSKLNIKSSRINESTELNAILNAVAATEMVPIYVKSELDLLDDFEPNVTFYSIYLPHTFSVADVKRMYGEELDSNQGKNLNDMHEELYGIVERNNSEIKDSLSQKCPLFEKPVIEPPMSRVMAEPAYEFMKTMLDHRMTKDVMQKIKDSNKE